MSNIPKWRTLGGYSGPVITGTMKSPPITAAEKRHVVRADYITFMVESGGLFGGIMGADGTVITAGRGQHAMVLPRVNAIGDLPRLIQLMASTKSEAVEDLTSAMKKLAGLWINQHGTLMSSSSGRGAATAVEVRMAMSVADGKVPSSGPDWDRAAQWAVTFSNAFADPSTFLVQEQYDQTQLIDDFNKLKIGSGAARDLVAPIVYGSQMTSSMIVGATVSEDLDLIMCMWHSFKVNAPTEARKVLEKAITLDNVADPDPMRPVASIPMLLATSSYGRWNKSIPNGRWDRTLKIVRQSKIWSDATIDRVVSKVR